MKIFYYFPDILHCLCFAFIYFLTIFSFLKYESTLKKSFLRIQESQSRMNNGFPHTRE